MSVTNNLNMDGLSDRIRQAAEMGVTRAAASIHALAVDRTPFREGHLRGSSQTLPAEWVGSVVRVMIAYNLIYAARQHEEMGWAHTMGQAKFLESALSDGQADARAIIATHLKGIL